MASTSIHLAAALSQLADTFDDQTMTRWFLDHDAEPNAETRIGLTPLSRALVHASIGIVEMLLNHGRPQSIDHGQLLHHAVHREVSDRLQVLEYLCTKGALRFINQLKYRDRPDLFEEENLICKSVDCRARVYANLVCVENQDQHHAYLCKHLEQE